MLIPPHVDLPSRFLIAHSDFFHALVFPDPQLTAWAAAYGIAKMLRVDSLRVKFRDKIEQRCLERREKLANTIYDERDVKARHVLLNGCIVPRPVLKPFYAALA